MDTPYDLVCMATVDHLLSLRLVALPSIFQVNSNVGKGRLEVSGSKEKKKNLLKKFGSQLPKVAIACTVLNALKIMIFIVILL